MNIWKTIISLLLTLSISVVYGDYAVVPNDVSLGQRKGLAEFQISERSSGDHMSVLFNASHHFGNDKSKRRIIKNMLQK